MLNDLVSKSREGLLMVNTDVFISYSRKDKDFVRQLYQDLRVNHRTIWVDWNNIPPTAEWLQEVYMGVEAADNFVYVISPDSLQSDICTKELEHALTYKKRLLPLVCRDVASHQVDSRVVALNWIFFRPSDDYNHALQTLIEALDTDLVYMHKSTRLLVRAREWEDQNLNTSFTLRGVDLLDAERWLAEGASKKPHPNTLQTEYISASRRAANSRQRNLLTGVSFALVLTILLSIFSFTQYQLVNRSNAILSANATAIIAKNATIRTDLQVAQAHALAASSISYLNANRLDVALLLAVKAYQTHHDYETRNTLFNALHYSPQLNTLINLGSSPQFVSPSQLFPYQDGHTFLYVNGNNMTFSYDAKARKSTPIHFPIPALSAPIAAMTPDGKLFALSTLGYKFLALWNSQSGEAPITIEDDYAPGHVYLNAAIFSPDKHLLAVANTLGIVLYPLASLRNPVILPYERPNVDSALMSQTLAFSANSRFLLYGGCAQYSGIHCTQGQLQMWDVKTAKALTTPITTQGDSIGALAFSPNGKYFASGSGDGTIALWDATTRRPIGIRLYGHTGRVNSLAFSPNNTLLVSGGNDKTVRLWDVSHQIALSEPLVGHPGEISNVAFTKDGMQLIASGNDGYILQWNVEQSGSISQTIRYVSQERAIDGSPESSGLNCLTASPSGKFLAACGDDGTILFWNIVNRHIGIQQYIKLSHLIPSDHAIVTTLIFSRDNQFLLACDSNQCWLIDRATKRQLWYNAPDNYTPGESSIAVGNLVLSPDGNTFALSTSSSDPESDSKSTVTNHFIEVRDMKTGKILHLLHDGPKTKATNDPRSLTDPDESYRIAFRPDGQLLVSEDMQGNIHLWDPRSGNNRGQMRRDISIPASMSIHSAVSFRPDGKILLSNSTNGQIAVWDMKTKKSVAQSFTSHVPGQPINNDQQIKSFTGIAWSPDGTTIAAVGSSQENVQTQYGISYGHDIVVWNATNSEPLLHPIHYEDGIFPQSLLFLPENMSLAVATFQELDGADLPSSNTITVWNLDSNTWIEEACILANRNLTPVEWKQFLPAESNYQKICPDLP